MIYLMIIYVLVIPHCKADITITSCKKKISLWGSERNEAKITNFIQGSEVTLKCDYCQENVAGIKTWYFKKRGSKYNEMKEITTEVYKNDNITLLDDGTLQMKNLNINNSGIYQCDCRTSDDLDKIFIHVLDGIFPSSATMAFGTLKQWHEYKSITLDTINQQFQKADLEPFMKFRDSFKFSFRLFILWNDWGPCVGHENDKAIRYRASECFLHPVPNNHYHLHTLNATIPIFQKIHNLSSLNGLPKKDRKKKPDPLVEDVNDYYLSENYDVSCYSVKLYKDIPYISEIVRKILQYNIFETCNYILNTTFVNFVVMESENYYLYTSKKQIPENGHITLTCPEVTLDSEVKWFKDNQLLGDSLRNNMAETEEEPHITIDSYNTLYVLHATKNEEGLYTCTVDGRKMQNFTISLVSKSKLLKDEFFRYSIYLSFVLTISLICYCTGVFVAFTRRSSFADPLNLCNKEH